MGPLFEVNFDGIVGPTHNFAGLSLGNVASLANESAPSSPASAALQGLDKMRAVANLGVRQAVLPPHARPSLSTLHRLGFGGKPEQVLADVAAREPRLLRLSSSASAMWAANAATVAPATDTTDGRLHIVPANLRHMFHRAIEADTTRDVLRAIFRDETRFSVHEPLPGGTQFADEGAANHTRLAVSSGRVAHLFAWGRSAFEAAQGEPQKYPARQTKEASAALARLLHLAPEQTVFAQQNGRGIDTGAFHTDVVAVGNESFFMVHELAFHDVAAVVADLRAHLGDELVIVQASERELPVDDAVHAYPFNSQVVTVKRDPLEMVIVAPLESRENDAARRFLERVVAEDNPVRRVEYLDVRQSMKNGGGPACLRQRIPLSAADLDKLGARVLFDDALEQDLRAWVRKHYRDRLEPRDLADPSLWRECLSALDELTRVLELGAVYEFQR
ncbi:MAG: N-succinylarginine dihydrolase [Polyangiaceae bacterium]|nr:N-succinylarginine dihydrolase [Polyangiaceae bacterium]